MNKWKSRQTRRIGINPKIFTARATDLVNYSSKINHNLHSFLDSSDLEERIEEELNKRSVASTNPKNDLPYQDCLSVQLENKSYWSRLS